MLATSIVVSMLLAIPKSPEICNSQNKILKEIHNELHTLFIDNVTTKVIDSCGLGIMSIGTDPRHKIYERICPRCQSPFIKIRFTVTSIVQLLYKFPKKAQVSN